MLWANSLERPKMLGDGARRMPRNNFDSYLGFPVEISLLFWYE